MTEQAVHPISDLRDCSLLLEATRGMLWSSDVEAVVAEVKKLVHELGGGLVSAADDHGHAVPIDVALGIGDPMLPVAEHGSASRAALERHLPQLVRDAFRVIELLERSQRFAEEATHDPLTGLWNRRMVTRLLPRIREGAVVALDLDFFKRVNDRLGHDAGDRVLRDFARAMSVTARSVDYVARMGGEEFLVVLDSHEAEPFLDRLREHWAESRGDPVTFSAGAAEIRGRAEDAVTAADRALYRAKQAGRNRWLRATDEEYP